MARDWDQELADIEHTRVTNNDKTREDESARRLSLNEAIQEFPEHKPAYEKEIAESERREKDFISRNNEIAASRSDEVKADRAAHEAAARDLRESGGLEFKDPPIPPQGGPANDNQWRVIEGKPPEPSGPGPEPEPEPPKPEAPKPESAPPQESSFSLRDVRDSWIGQALDKAALFGAGLGVAGHLANAEPAMTTPSATASAAPVSGPQVPGEQGEGEDEVKGAKATKDEDDKKRTDWQKGVDAANNAHQNAKSPDNAKSPSPPGSGGPEPPQEPQGPRQLTSVYGLELKPPPPPPPPPPANDNQLSEGKGR
jgi:hypothetical protein